MNITADKHIPIPNQKSDLFAIMEEVGDSIWLDKPQSAIAASASQWGKRQTPPRKFTTRKESKDGVDGTRIWRIT